jgi:uncharacterized protein with HEPN domain
MCFTYTLFRCVQAQERKAALRKIPEQAILGEVRRMVEEMQTLNKKLEETVSFSSLAGITWKMIIWLFETALKVVIDFI